MDKGDSGPLIDDTGAGETESTTSDDDTGPGVAKSTTDDDDTLISMAKGSEESGINGTTGELEFIEGDLN